MGASRWDESVRVFNKSEGDDAGLPTRSYAFVDSGESDGGFPMSRGVPSGRDTAVAGQREHRADAVFCCPDDVPVQDSSILRDLEDDRIYRVIKKEHARRRGEFVLVCEHASLDSEATLTLTGEP